MLTKEGNIWRQVIHFTYLGREVIYEENRNLSRKAHTQKSRVICVISLKNTSVASLTYSSIIPASICRGVFFFFTNATLMRETRPFGHRGCSGGHISNSRTMIHGGITVTLIVKKVVR